jgi:hypothetical protein
MSTSLDFSGSKVSVIVIDLDKPEHLSYTYANMFINVIPAPRSRRSRRTFGLVFGVAERH